MSDCCFKMWKMITNNECACVCVCALARLWDYVHCLSSVLFLDLRSVSTFLCQKITLVDSCSSWIWATHPAVSPNQTSWLWARRQTVTLVRTSASSSETPSCSPSGRFSPPLTSNGWALNDTITSTLEKTWNLTPMCLEWITPHSNRNITFSFIRHEDHQGMTRMS